MTIKPKIEYSGNLQEGEDSLPRSTHELLVAKIFEMIQLVVPAVGEDLEDPRTQVAIMVHVAHPKWKGMHTLTNIESTEVRSAILMAALGQAGGMGVLKLGSASDVRDLLEQVKAAIGAKEEKKH